MIRYCFLFLLQCLSFFISFVSCCVYVLGVSIRIHGACLLISEDLENSIYFPLTGESDDADGKFIYLDRLLLTLHYCKLDQFIGMVL